jgi:NodT family efflux transporter outer membrane factor (OMF) lipoprotein
MKTKLIVKTSVLSIFVLVFAACKSLKNPAEPSFESIPKMFSSATTDSINSSMIQPKELLNDPLLIGLIDTALSRNLSLIRSNVALTQLEADVLEARTNMLPKVGAYVGYSNRRFGLHTMDGAGNITTTIGDGELIPINLNDFNFGLQTSWEIDVWGKLKQQKKAAFSRLLAAKETQNMLKTWIIEQVAINYFNLICLDETKSIISQNIELNTNLIGVLKAQKEAGRTTELSIQQFEALILNYSNSLLQVEQEIVFAENELRKLIGSFDADIKRSLFESNPMLTLTIKEGIPAQLLSNRPDIRQAEQQILASKADLSAARKMFYPSLSINGNIGYQAYKTRFLFTSPESIAYGLFGNLMAPLINMGELKANFKRASASQLDAYYAYQETILGAFTEINNGLFAIKNTQKMLDNKTKENDLLNQSRQTASELFNSNRADYLEVLFAQQNVLTAEFELMELYREMFTLKIYLYKSLGGGWK